MSQPALFLDRDGTLVHPRHYPRRPDELMIFENLPRALKVFQAHGWRLVVITNQSGIARGYLSEVDLRAMHSHLAAELGRQGIGLDGVYYCPHHPEGSVAPFNIACECRKPGPAMLLRAAADLGLALGASWFVGDILDDVEAGHRAGCRAALVDLGSEPAPTSPLRTPDLIGRDTAQALRAIAAHEGLGEPMERAYVPARWGVTAAKGACHGPR